MTRKQKRNVGIFLIAFPIPLIFLTLIAYSIVGFIIGSAVGIDGGSTGLVVVGNIINVVLGLFGIVGVAGIFIAVPIGIFLLVASEKEDEDDKEKKPGPIEKKENGS